MVFEALENAKMSARLAATDGSNCHLLAMAWIASDRGVDAALIQRDDAFHQSQVAFRDPVFLHLLDESGLRTRIFCYNEQPGCVFIQAVNNTGAYRFLFAYTFAFSGL